MSDKTWKAFECRLAHDVGTERIPVTGERDGADFEDGGILTAPGDEQQMIVLPDDV